MEPLHLTEFASPRYFDKLRLTDQPGPDSNGSTSGQNGTSPSPSINHSSTLDPVAFDLPSKQHIESLALRPRDQRRRTIGHDVSPLRVQNRKHFTGSLGAIRLKKANHAQKPSIVEFHREIVTGIIEDERISLFNLFKTLPIELQTQVVATLPVHTILDLRLVSKFFHALITSNESQIARYHAEHSLPNYTIRLYPLPDSTNMNLHYLAGIWHRLHVSSKLSTMIALQAQREIFLRTTEAQVREFQPQFGRMRQRLIPLVFTIFHFFETYRKVYASHLARRGAPLTRLPFTINPFESYVMGMYDDRTLLHAHEVFPLIMSSFSRRLRPPSYVGKFERSFRGYLKDRPTDATYATILTVGGLRQAQRFWETDGYNIRRAAVDEWYEFLQSGHLPVVDPTPVTPKSKMAKFTHLGRKKASPQPVDPTAMDIPCNDSLGCRGWFCVKPKCMSAVGQPSGKSRIFHTSLAAGPPMRPLKPEVSRLLVDNLPELHDIWAKTAEATILERRIVDRPQRIKKNTTVLLDLIREDGREEMEAWESGRPESSDMDAWEMIDGRFSD